MDINWDALGAVGEILGAIGVIITLIYLSVQLRQNTSAIRSSTWQAVQDAELSFDQYLTENREIAELWIKGSVSGIDTFDDPVDRFQFMTIGKQLVDQFQTHHYQFERGLIEPEMWETWITQFTAEADQSPGFRDVVRIRYPHLRPGFRRFIDDHMSTDS